MADNKMNESLLAFAYDADTVEVLESLNLNRFGLKLEVQQANVKAAAAYLKVNHSPTYLIVDLTGSEFPVTDMKAIAEVCEPGVQVIAIGERNDVGIYRDLLELGVKDYIAKPINTTLLMRSIEALMGKGSSQQEGFVHSGKMVSFIGARGGVGSTTFAANTAWTMANKHFKRVCALDLDFYHGSLSQNLGVDSSPALEEILQNPDRIDDGILSRLVVNASEHLASLSCPVPLDDDFPFPKAGIETLMPVLLNRYHYTFIDFPLFNYDQHFTLLSRSNVIVMTFDFNLLSIRAMASMLKILHPSSDQRIVLVGNMSGQYSKGQLTKEMLEDSIQRTVDIVSPFDANMPLQALNEGLALASEQSKLTNSFDELASIISGKEHKKSTKSKSFLSDLFGARSA